MVAGIKGIAHDLAYLSNDDVATPTAMMGKKMVPILELGRPGSDEHEVSRITGTWPRSFGVRVGVGVVGVSAEGVMLEKRISDVTRGRKR